MDTDMAAFLGNTVGALFVALPAWYYYLRDTKETTEMRAAEDGTSPSALQHPYDTNAKHTIQRALARTVQRVVNHALASDSGNRGGVNRETDTYHGLAGIALMAHHLASLPLSVEDRREHEYQGEMATKPDLAAMSDKALHQALYEAERSGVFTAHGHADANPHLAHAQHIPAAQETTANTTPEMVSHLHPHASRSHAPHLHFVPHHPRKMHIASHPSPPLAFLTSSVGPSTLALLRLVAPPPNPAVEEQDVSGLGFVRYWREAAGTLRRAVEVVQEREVGGNKGSYGEGCEVLYGLSGFLYTILRIRGTITRLQSHLSANHSSTPLTAAEMRVEVDPMHSSSLEGMDVDSPPLEFEHELNDPDLELPQGTSAPLAFLTSISTDEVLFVIVKAIIEEGRRGAGVYSRDAYGVGLDSEAEGMRRGLGAGPLASGFDAESASDTGESEMAGDDRPGMSGAEGARTHEVRYIGGPPPLMWRWHGKWYLGAAHGLAGILHMLFMCPTSIVGPYEWEILRTLEFLLGLQDAEGGWETKAPSGGHHSHDNELVQWCHGAPGILLLLACTMRASSLSNPKSNENQHRGIVLPPHLRGHVARAIDTGARYIYRRGLLRKGLGVCHGVAGSVYALLGAARVLETDTDSPHSEAALAVHDPRQAKHTFRADVSAQRTASEGHPQQHLHQPKHTHLNHALHLAYLATQYEDLTACGEMHVSDMPWSLYGGAAGMCCAWGDVLCAMEGRWDESEVPQPRLLHHMPGSSLANWDDSQFAQDNPSQNHSQDKSANQQPKQQVLQRTISGVQRKKESVPSSSKGAELSWTRQKGSGELALDALDGRVDKGGSGSGQLKARPLISSESRVSYTPKAPADINKIFDVDIEANAMAGSDGTQTVFTEDAEGEIVHSDEVMILDHISDPRRSTVPTTPPRSTDAFDMLFTPPAGTSYESLFSPPPAALPPQAHRKRKSRADLIPYVLVPPLPLDHADYRAIPRLPQPQRIRPLHHPNDTAPKPQHSQPQPTKGKSNRPVQTHTGLGDALHAAMNNNGALHTLSDQQRKKKVAASSSSMSISSVSTAGERRKSRPHPVDVEMDFDEAPRVLKRAKAVPAAAAGPPVKNLSRPIPIVPHPSSVSTSVSASVSSPIPQSIPPIHRTKAQGERDGGVHYAGTLYNPDEDVVRLVILGVPEEACDVLQLNTRFVRRGRSHGGPDNVEVGSVEDKCATSEIGPHRLGKHWPASWAEATCSSLRDAEENLTTGESLDVWGVGEGASKKEDSDQGGEEREQNDDIVFLGTRPTVGVPIGSGANATLRQGLPRGKTNPPPPPPATARPPPPPPGNEKSQDVLAKRREKQKQKDKGPETTQEAPSKDTPTSSDHVRRPSAKAIGKQKAYAPKRIFISSSLPPPQRNSASSHSNVNLRPANSDAIMTGPEWMPPPQTFYRSIAPPSSSYAPPSAHLPVAPTSEASDTDELLYPTSLLNPAPQSSYQQPVPSTVHPDLIVDDVHMTLSDSATDFLVPSLVSGPSPFLPHASSPLASLSPFLAAPYHDDSNSPLKIYTYPATKSQGNNTHDTTITRNDQYLEDMTSTFTQTHDGLWMDDHSASAAEHDLLDLPGFENGTIDPSLLGGNLNDEGSAQLLVTHGAPSPPPSTSSQRAGQSSYFESIVGYDSSPPNSPSPPSSPSLPLAQLVPRPVPSKSDSSSSRSPLRPPSLTGELGYPDADESQSSYSPASPSSHARSLRTHLSKRRAPNGMVATDELQLSGSEHSVSDEERRPSPSKNASTKTKRKSLATQWPQGGEFIYCHQYIGERAYSEPYLDFVCPLCQDNCTCDVCTRKRGEVYVSFRKNAGAQKSSEDSRKERDVPTRTRRRLGGKTDLPTPAVAGPVTHWATVYDVNGQQMGNAFVGADGNEEVVVLRPLEGVKAAESAQDDRKRTRILVGEIQDSWGFGDRWQLRDENPVSWRDRNKGPNEILYVGSKAVLQKAVAARRLRSRKAHIYIDHNQNHGHVSYEYGDDNNFSSPLSSLEETSDADEDEGELSLQGPSVAEADLAMVAQGGLELFLAKGPGSGFSSDSLGDTDVVRAISLGLLACGVEVQLSAC
ncbi:hypothetical protein DXG03_000939 [Asterophora parasitica]|uniref:Uncharacterized protein n=1 Tax=Asterophora parasitica TaxID=117018 RepID=A0A9P7G5F6_9AGAR|nr:hypothetical protein DXG03_000939 [Asterophora parasitica]